MATLPLLSDGHDPSGKDMNLEIFCLIWLDADVNSKDIRDTEQKLRSIISRLKKFHDIEQCQSYIEQQSKNDRLIMIVSGRLGREIVPTIHEFQQIIAIYVHCINNESNEKWARKFSKVRAVIVELNELLARIKADHRIQKIVEEPLSVNFFSAGKSTGDVNGKFVFSQVLIDCLLRLKYTKADKVELIKLCKNANKDDTYELSIIQEFQKEYSPNKVLWWYTRNSFFYKTLNSVLRTENIHMIFLLRAFIADIQRQLKTYQAQNILRVYRGQMISREELKALKKSSGQFISINSFFSTSTDRRQACAFLESAKDNLEAVLFEIEANPKMATTKPFADISPYSDIPDEAEILFMLGSIFRLNSITRSPDNKVWIIRMNLCNDDEHELKQVLMDMKQEIGDSETNLRTLGKILWEMSKLDLAEKYLVRFLEQLPSDDPLLGDLYQDLGKLASQKGDLDKSMEWRQKALALKKQNPSMSIPSDEETSKYRFIPDIPAKARWSPNGATVAGGNGKGSATSQLYYPSGLFVDEDQTIIIADSGNNRFVQWKKGDKNGQVVGDPDQGSGFNFTHDVLIDRETDSLIFSESNRVMRWPHLSGTKQGEIFIDQIAGEGLAMDDQRNLYICDSEKHEVRRYQIGDNKGTVVAGGNGNGDRLNQLNLPTFICVDRQQSIYVSDLENSRVVKWNKGATTGILVAGGQGHALKKLLRPRGLVVDISGTLYIADQKKHRVLRWPQGATQGTVIVGGNGEGSAANQLSYPNGLSFDRQGNLYVADSRNHRVQRFSIDGTDSGCILS